MGDADRDWTHFNRLVTLDHVDECPLRTSLNRDGRDEGGSLLDIQEQSSIDELVGEQFIVVVGEDRLELDGAGGRVNLVVDRQQRSRGQPPLSLPIISLDRHALPGFELGKHRGETIFRNGEDHGNGLQLRNDHQPRGIARVHNVAGVHQAQPHSPTDRRGDPAVDQIHLDALDLSLIVLDGPFILTDQSLLGIQLLLLDRILRPQHLIALQVEPRVLQQSLVARQLSLELSQLRFERTRVDFSQQVPLVDELTFLEPDAHQLSIDAGMDGDGIQRSDRSKSVEVDADVPRFRRRCHHRHGAREGVRSLFGSTRLSLARLCEEDVGANGNYGRATFQNTGITTASSGGVVKKGEPYRIGDSRLKWYQKIWPD